MAGTVKVTVQREDRLKAINNLAEAVWVLAQALNTPVVVNVTGCTISDVGTGVSIDTADEVTRTEIVETE